jgi:transcriptional regulator with XRE-family HTH domain
MKMGHRSDDVERLFAGLRVVMRGRRARLELTQHQAARRAGLSDNHWSTLETGKERPRVASLLGIAKALDTTLPSLLEEALASAPTRDLHGHDG